MNGLALNSMSVAGVTGLLTVLKITYLSEGKMRGNTRSHENGTRSLGLNVGVT